MKLLRIRNQRRQTGFSIIEIMIALALGVIIMLGVTQIATNNSSTRYELERSGRQIENAAYALRELENDLTNAAFWGEKGAENPASFLPPVCPNDKDELKEAMGYPVQGGTIPAAPGNNFSCVPAAITAKAGTNYLAIRRANSCAFGDDGCEADDTNFHLKVHACFLETSTDKPGDFEIFTGDGVENYTQRDCATPAPRYRFLSRIYYINEDDELVRAELVGTTYVETPIVEGVEWMRIVYGMDRNGDGQVDGQATDTENERLNAYTTDPRYDLATNTADFFPQDAWANVVMARIFLVVRNTEPSGGGFTDDKVYTVAGAAYTVPAAFKNNRRQVYSRTVSLRNVAGRRQVE